MEPDPSERIAQKVESLRREVWLTRADRGLAAAVLAVCTIGGTGVGFGLSMLFLVGRPAPQTVLAVAPAAPLYPEVAPTPMPDILFEPPDVLVDPPDVFMVPPIPPVPAIAPLPHPHIRIHECDHGRRHGHGWLGVILDEVDDEVYVVDIAAGSPADRRLQLGDRIVAIDDEDVDDPDDVTELIRDHDPGEAIVIRVGRGDTEHLREIVLGGQ